MVWNASLLTGNLLEYYRGKVFYKQGDRSRTESQRGNHFMKGKSKRADMECSVYTRCTRTAE